MNKTNYIQLGALIALISIAGCAANSNPNNPLSTVGQGLSTVEGAAQSGQQILNAGTAAASNPAGINQIGLVDILVHRLGVSPQQALGGAGAIFQAAQGNMNPQAFATLSKSIPGMDSMLNAAPAMSGVGGLSSLTGSSGSAVSSVAALAASFQQLNLSPDMVGQFIPVVTNYVGKTSGQVTADLFQSALTAK
ncbi:uncharacterized protein VcgC/VcgE DUF2780 [Nitrosomonas sp. Nm84]|uniref:DUF2780 domain-containing protein n=1 Tax=Nitrosomonas sp. Nm84 TaxID=200124 RepID=UPI000D76B1C3|nr:DUF2780 domain-containing protein [Nitrosomonas sp. Nm84]PXW84949.1 uncharacterized protein VcgC/VcgE DUF2780 [Nitrosomonas sp. Nm84]